MANNKVQLADGTVLVDLTGDTVTAGDVASGVTFHGSDGAQHVGTAAHGSAGATVEVKTASGTGSTSLSFSGLSAQPKAFMIMADAQFTASSTRCVTGVTYDGTTTRGTWNYQQSNKSWGILYYSGSYFSYTYSNGTLTVRTSSTTNGGVFKSGTAYRLIAVY